MIPGLKIILMGAPGSGKTHSIRTLIDAGLEVFCILTEPNAINTLTNMEMSSIAYKSAIADGKLHWHFVQPADPGWESLKKSARLITTYSIGDLQKLPGMNKADYAQFLEVLDCCSDFKDDLSGKSFGPIEAFDPHSQVVVIDSLSGLNTMFLNLVVGAKPIRTLPEWGVAIDNELRFIDHLCYGIPCHVILMAHLDRQVDEVMGGIRRMVNALGKKAPQEMPKSFTDVILASEDAGTFSWSTSDAQTDTKATTGLARASFSPSFVPLIEIWRERALLTETGDKHVAI